jgi:hypothetical protein
MARTGRPKTELTLAEEERVQLVRWSRRAKSSQALALRSKIVLACAKGTDNKDVAAQLNCAVATVGKWRGRFVAERLDGLVDEPRPGRPATISVEAVEAVAGLDGQAFGVVQDDDRADLEGLRAQAAPGRWVQTVHGPAVRGFSG